MTAQLAAAAPLRGGGRREGKAGPERREEEEGTRRRHRGSHLGPRLRASRSAQLGPARPPWALRPWPTLPAPARRPKPRKSHPGKLLCALAARRRRHAPCRPGPASASLPAPPGRMERGRRPGLGQRFTPRKAGASSGPGPTVPRGVPTALGRHLEPRPG